MWSAGRGWPCPEVDLVAGPEDGTGAEEHRDEGTNREGDSADPGDALEIVHQEGGHHSDIGASHTDDVDEEPSAPLFLRWIRNNPFCTPLAPIRSLHHFLPVLRERKRSKADAAHQLVDLLSSCSLLIPNVEQHTVPAPSESFPTGNAD